MLHSVIYAFECVKYGIRRSATFRAAWVAAVLASLIQLVVMVSVWTALIRTGTASGYDLDDAAAYTLFVLFLWSANNTWIVRDIESEVRDGRVERLLLRPVNVAVTYLAIGFGKVLFNISVVGPPILLLFFAWRTVDISMIPIDRAVCVLMSVLLSIIMYLLIDLCVGFSSFWTITTFGIDMIKENIIRLLSGATVPLIFYPEALQPTLSLLPFSLMFFKPAHLFVQQAPFSEYLTLFALQSLWIAVLSVIVLAVVYRVRQFISVAGG